MPPWKDGRVGWGWCEGFGWEAFSMCMGFVLGEYCMKSENVS